MSLLAPLAEELGVDLAALLSGELSTAGEPGGNMKRARYFVCPACGGIALATGDMDLSCCGRRLTPLTPQRAEGEDRLQVRQVDDEWFVTASHPMEKGHYIAFAALASGDRIQLIRQYPEWDFQLRLPAVARGTLLWYCTRHGLFSQPLGPSR